MKKGIYDEFARTGERKVKSELEVRAIQTKALELRGKTDLF